MMQIRNTPDRYGAVAQLLHWTIVLLIVLQFVLASIFDDLPLGMEKIHWIVRHKAVGMTVLMLAIIRLAWRFWNPRPALPPAMPAWQRFVAHGVHFALYALILLIPVSGWVMSSLAKIPVSYFGLFDFPSLMAPNKAWVDASKDLHELLVDLLVVVAGLHIAAALKHHFVDHDDTLKKMLPRFRRS